MAGGGGCVAVPDSASLSRPTFSPADGGDLYDWRGVPPELHGRGVRAADARGAVRRRRPRGGLPLQRPVGRARCAADDDRAAPRREDRSRHRRSGRSAATRRETFRVVVTHFGTGLRPRGGSGWRCPPDGRRRPGRLSTSCPGEALRRRSSSTWRRRAGSARPRSSSERWPRMRTVGATGTGSYTIDYPHIRAAPTPPTSAAQVHVAPIALPAAAPTWATCAARRTACPRRCAGRSADRDARRGRRSPGATSSRYDAIVVGSRAYETDPALRPGQRPAARVRRGTAGCVIVQYQQYPFFDGRFRARSARRSRAPHDRVTDETAGGAAARARERGLQRPNAIGPATGTAGCRSAGLYFAHTWDPAYRPLLEWRIRARPTAAGRPAGGPGRQGHLRLHRPRLLPAAAGRRARRLSAVREPAGAARQAAAAREATGAAGSLLRPVARAAAAAGVPGDGRTPCRRLLAARPRPAGALEKAFEASIPTSTSAGSTWAARRSRPRPLRERQSAGRRLVRRPDDDLRSRRRRLAAGAVPAVVGRRRWIRAASGPAISTSGLPHAGGASSTTRRRSRRERGARTTGTTCSAPRWKGQDPDSRSRGERHHARASGG